MKFCCLSTETHVPPAQLNIYMLVCGAGSGAKQRCSGAFACHAHRKRVPHGLGLEMHPNKSPTCSSAASTSAFSRRRCDNAASRSCSQRMRHSMPRRAHFQALRQACAGAALVSLPS